jgi:hypothetical protein
MTWFRGRHPEASREGTRGVEISVVGVSVKDKSAWPVVAAPMRLAHGKGQVDGLAMGMRIALRFLKSG